MSANDNQVAGDHYVSDLQHWDFVRLARLEYEPAQATRYVTRWRKKNGLEDLEKCLHYIQKFIEVKEAESNFTMANMNKFINANEIGFEEAQVISQLVHFQIGEMDRLYNAEALVKKMLEILRGPKYEDPEFKQDNDEWKTK